MRRRTLLTLLLAAALLVPAAAATSHLRPLRQFSVTPLQTDLGTHVAGDTVLLRIQINNTGREALQTIWVNSTDLGISRTETVQIAPYQVTGLQFDGTAPLLDGNQVQLTVDAPRAPTRTITVTMTTYPDYGERFAALAQNASQLEQRLAAKAENLSVERDMDLFRERIRDGQTAFQEERYDRAGQLLEQAQQSQTALRDRIAALPAAETDDDRGGGLPLLPAAAGALLLLLGAILYLSIVPDEPGGQYIYVGRSQS